MISDFSPQHPFVTQLLTRNLVIELLDMANNPELHSAHTHSLDESDLEVSAAKLTHKKKEATRITSFWFSLLSPALRQFPGPGDLRKHFWPLVHTEIMTKFHTDV